MNEQLTTIGPLYYLYMSLLSTFATNSINILAGINGSEVSQALIIALSVIINDLLYLPWPIDFRIPLHLLGNKAELEFGGVWSAGMAHGSRELVERHLFSLYFMMPLVAVCLGFLYHNWYVLKHNFRVCSDDLRTGILRAPSPEIHYAMLRVWRSRLLASRHISPKLYSCSSFHKYSTSYSRVHSYSDLFPVLDTGCQGTLTINGTCRDLRSADSIPIRTSCTRPRLCSSIRHPD
jgi:Glycosyl transferase family 4